MQQKMCYLGYFPCMESKNKLKNVELKREVCSDPTMLEKDLSVTQKIWLGKNKNNSYAEYTWIPYTCPLLIRSHTRFNERMGTVQVLWFERKMLTTDSAVSSVWEGSESFKRWNLTRRGGSLWADLEA